MEAAHETESKGRRRLLRAERLLFDVSGVNADIPEVHACLGVLRRLQGRLSDFKIALELSISLAPNYSLAFGQLGQTLINLGQPKAAIPHLERSLRLAPHTPDTPVFYHALGSLLRDNLYEKERQSG